MTQSQPLVSVILATRNGQQYLNQAITSVLEQTYQNIELIIIDDASTTPMTLDSDSRIKVTRNQKPLGLTKSLNAGLVLATGEYVARIDDDDLWIDKTKLTRQVAFLEAQPDIGLCGTLHTVIDEGGRELFRLQFSTTDVAIRQQMLRANQFVHSGVVIQRAALDQVGNYNENLPYAQDYELWLRIGTKFKLANLASYSVAKRINKNSVTNKHHRQQWWIAAKTAYKYRHQYPGFYEAVPLYIREGLLNLIPKSLFQKISILKRGRHS